MKTAIVGASGFIGKALTTELTRRGQEVLPVVRSASGISGELIAGELGDGDWGGILRGCDTVVHLAARVHQMRDDAADPLFEFRRINRDGAIAVARGAAAAGVRRMVFVSTVKVNGDASGERSFAADDVPQPCGSYAVSKAEAEALLFEFGAASGLEVVVVRPPLVYGPGVQANFAAMLRAIRWGIPLPFGAIDNNCRSLVGIDNLVDLLIRCLDHTAAPGRVFLVTDGKDVSTAGLLRLNGDALGRKVRLIPIPASLLFILGRLTGRDAAIERLTGNLQVDISETRAVLDWSPPFSIEEQLHRTAVEFLTR